MKLMFWASMGAIFLIGCNGQYDKLTRYYKKNLPLHSAVADSLINFTKRNKSDVIIRVRSDLDNKIFFLYHVKRVNTYFAIEYDSLLRRSDPDPEYTANIDISIALIRDIKRGIYPSIRADSNQVFFGYKYFSDGNFQYGILIDKNISKLKNKCIAILDSSACIYKGLIP